jgi:hypothetical protein
MLLEHVPLLQIQRDLHDIPRGMQRFQEYIRTLTGGTGEIVLPIGAMNPMGKEHVAALLDALLALGGEGTAAAAADEAQGRLARAPGQLKLGLVVCDDAQGGWTNRYFTETSQRFNLLNLLKRGWVAPLCWTSEAPSAERVRAAVLAEAYRAAHTLVHGEPRTLGQMLDQEGRAAVFAGATEPQLDPEELAYSRELIALHRATSNFPTAFACLYGDEIAAASGYSPLGLSPRAGYAVALADALASGRAPEELL